MGTILERIEQLAKNEGITITALEKEIGASKGVLSRAINKGTDIQTKWLQNIVENYPRYSAKWLISGKGDMCDDEGAPNYSVARRFKLRTDRIIEQQNIPLYELEATAGLVSLFLDNSSNVVLGYISVPEMPHCDGAVYVRGDSMYPLLKSGDIVLYKQIHNFKSGILWGEMYLISFELDGEEFVTIKYLQKSEIEQHVKLVSQNQHHASQDIPLNNIRALAMIKCSIRYNTMR